MRQRRHLLMHQGHRKSVAAWRSLKNSCADIAVKARTLLSKPLHVFETAPVSEAVRAACGLLQLHVCPEQCTLLMQLLVAKAGGMWDQIWGVA